MNLRHVVLYFSTLLVFCVSSSAVAVDIEETIWGFDGNVVPNRFNLVSLLVSNTSEEPVGIQLELRRTGDRLGAKVQEAVFLSPFSSRWVQFYPYITNANQDWEASWGFLPGQRKDLPRPNIGGPARIALLSSNDPNAARGKVKSFPEELFPPFVSATDTLDAVILDHNPRWQAQRRLCLLHWVQRGGTLLVTPTTSGEFPEFTGEMSILNQPIPASEFGQGYVIRCKDRTAAVQQAEARLGSPTATWFSTQSWEVGERVFRTLKSITTPKHNWWVINIMSVIYVGLVFPGWYLLAKGATHYRTTILAFVGVSVLFTVAFNLIGRRGYGESTAVNSLAIARKVDGRQYDVTSWTNVFVTGGDDYELNFPGTGHLYATPYENQRVAAVIDNGLDGKFQADIPLFSSRSFLHRGLMPGPEWKVEVAEADYGYERGEQSIRGLKLRIWPKPKAQVHAVLGEKLYAVYADGEDYRLRATNKTVGESLLPAGFRDNNDYRYRRDQPVKDVAMAFAPLNDVAIWFAMGRDLAEEPRRPLPGDLIRLFILDDLPSTFSVKHPDLSASQGRVLYSLDVRLPETLNLESQEEAPEFEDGDGMEEDESSAEFANGELDIAAPRAEAADGLALEGSDERTASEESTTESDPANEDADEDNLPEEATSDVE